MIGSLKRKIQKSGQHIILFAFSETSFNRRSELIPSGVKSHRDRLTERISPNSIFVQHY